MTIRDQSLDVLKDHLERKISLTPAEFDFLTSLLKSKSLKKDECLIRPGEICKYESFVTRGCLKSFYEDDRGTVHIVDFCVEGWWADDLYSFFTQTPSRSTIMAIEPTEVLQISFRDLELLYEKVPKFERFFRLLFQRAYIAQREQINLMLSATAEERYRIFLQKKPYAEERFSQQDIASYLGITPQFLSAMKKKLRG
jgi:CRP-like cAMP-binding protein